MTKLEDLKLKLKKAIKVRKETINKARLKLNTSIKNNNPMSFNDFLLYKNLVFKQNMCVYIANQKFLGEKQRGTKKYKSLYGDSKSKVS